jgi:cell division transport system ATP-binding protein
VITFESVGLRYSLGPEVLRDVSFHIGTSSFQFITGPSGAGKTSLLRLLFLSLRPTRGSVRIFNRDAATLPRTAIPGLRRRIGIVFQDFRLLEDRTAEANIAFALEVTGAPRGSIGPRVSRALTQVGLSSKAQAFPRELSGGEQQRVAIARALVNDPVVLLADEPTGNLDERATRGVFELLRDINASGTAVMMATHDLALVQRSDCRVIEVNHGQVVLDSAPGTTP